MLWISLGRGILHSVKPRGGRCRGDKKRLGFANSFLSGRNFRVRRAKVPIFVCLDFVEDFCAGLKFLYIN